MNSKIIVNVHPIAEKEWTRLNPQQVLFSKKGELESSKASARTVSIVKDFLDRIGVGIETVDKIVVNGIRQDAQGAALIMQKLIQVVEGKDNVALPEEAMHFAVEIIQQTDPKLFNQLLKEINAAIDTFIIVVREIKAVVEYILSLPERYIQYFLGCLKEAYAELAKQFADVAKEVSGGLNDATGDILSATKDVLTDTASSMCSADSPRIFLAFSSSASTSPSLSTSSALL